MPKHYPGKVIYQKQSEFTPISKANLATYEVLRRSDDLIYLLHPGHGFGFVFSEEEVQSATQHVIPVMRLALSDTRLDYKQVSRLRIHEGFSRLNAATQWYLAYAECHGGIVSDREHLEGGRRLWEGLIKIARSNPKYEVLLADLSGKEVVGSAVDLPLEQIWSTDDSCLNLVLIFKAAGAC